MPKAARTSTASAPSARKEPYSKHSRSRASDTEDKENVMPGSSSKSSSKAKASLNSKSHQPCDNPNVDWRDIELEEKKGEVPCYDSASAVRRKLNKLLQKKEPIPCPTDTGKKWTQASMAREMMDLEQRMGAPEPANRNCNGPSVGSLGKFLKKQGEMGGGDSACYYWGNVLLEKLRIYNGEKKSKSRKDAEESMPNGHRRWDPSTMKFWSGPGLPPPSYHELVNTERE